MHTSGGWWRSLLSLETLLEVRDCTPFWRCVGALLECFLVDKSRWRSLEGMFVPWRPSEEGKGGNAKSMRSMAVQGGPYWSNGGRRGTRLSINGCPWWSMDVHDRWSPWWHVNQKGKAWSPISSNVGSRGQCTSAFWNAIPCSIPSSVCPGPVEHICMCVGRHYVFTNTYLCAPVERASQTGSVTNNL